LRQLDETSVDAATRVLDAATRARSWSRGVTLRARVVYVRFNPTDVSCRCQRKLSTEGLVAQSVDSLEPASYLGSVALSGSHETANGIHRRPPSPLDDVDAALAAHYGRLSPSQRRAIDRLVADTRYGAVVSPAELARLVNVHPSVVTRAAQVLGFEGFPDLQARLRAGFLQLQVQPQPHVPHGVSTGVQDETPEAIALASLLADAEYIRSTAEALSPHTFESVVSALVKARRVYIFGAVGSHGLALLLGMALRLLLPDTRLLRQDYGDLAEQAVGLDASDVLVVIGFHKVGRITTELVRWAASLGATTIGITDSRSNAVARAASHALYAHIGGQRQLKAYPAAGTSLVNAIATAVALRTGDSARLRIEAAHQLSTRLGTDAEV
jgi:DNA-binding MurR/RpiR family transcriptional regulator